MEEADTFNAVLVEGKDYYFDQGLMVLTAAYHLRRGYCCEQGCRHCPYEDRAKGLESELIKADK